jgi:hypothetical protein
MFQKDFGTNRQQEKLLTDELAKNLWVSPEDDFHVRIGSKNILKSYLTIMSSRN